jgi:hypothetical protein
MLLAECTTDEVNAYLNDFCQFVYDELGVAKIPMMTFVSKTGQASFGSYHLGRASIIVALEGRHVADVLRTLAHEIVHHVQLEQDSPLDLDGLEREANGVAGMLMRVWNQRHPEMYGVEAVPVAGLDSEGESSISQGVPTNPPYPTEIAEEGPVNASGSGAVAGLGVGPQGEPGVSPKKKHTFRMFRRRLIKE